LLLIILIINDMNPRKESNAS